MHMKYRESIEEETDRREEKKRKEKAKVVAAVCGDRVECRTSQAARMI